jgi:hypothetical protein
MTRSLPLGRLVRSRGIRPSFPWRDIQNRCESAVALASAPTQTYDVTAEDHYETRHEPNIYPSRLDGISIAYHLRRRRVLEYASRTPRNSRIIGIQDPITGYLYMDEPGVVDEQLEVARDMYANTSVAERRRMVLVEMADVVQQQSLTVRSKDYGTEDSSIKRILKRQLLDCMTTKDIFRVVAAALQNRHTAVRLSKLGEQIVRAFFRSRSNATDTSIATRILVLIRRFDVAGLLVQPILVTHGLKFAIRSRDLDLTKRFLKELRRRKLELSSTTFRAVIAKCSIGRQGFGEIRNGRWKRDELLQVLLGFKDALPGQEYHLKTFLNRTDWQYVAAWSQILSRCGAYDELWQEWLWWRNSSARRENKSVTIIGGNQTIPWNWRLRGDRWFVQVFIDAGLFDWAWTVLKETGLDPFLLRRECLHQLMERIDLASFWDDRLQRALVEKLTEDLAAIEQMMGVEWVQEDGFSYHVPTEKWAEALEMLSEPDFFTKYGYITNDTDD